MLGVDSIEEKKEGGGELADGLPEEERKGDDDLRRW